MDLLICLLWLSWPHLLQASGFHLAHRALLPHFSAYICHLEWGLAPASCLYHAKWWEHSSSAHIYEQVCGVSDCFHCFWRSISILGIRIIFAVAARGQAKSLMQLETEKLLSMRPAYTNKGLATGRNQQVCSSSCPPPTSNLTIYCPDDQTVNCFFLKFMDSLANVLFESISVLKHCPKFSVRVLSRAVVLQPVKTQSGPTLRVPGQ